MFSFLKNHPFAVEAFFESSIVLTFAVSKEELAPLIPPCLELDIFNGKWAFIAVAMVQTKSLRPKHFPKMPGNDFFLIGYRIFTRYRNSAGKSLRGLYILKSFTDKKKMEWLGNIFTHYNYSATDIAVLNDQQTRAVKSVQSGVDLVVKDGDKNVALPEGSPFQSWKEARRFAGPLPFTFTYNTITKNVLIIEGVRQYWEPAPVEVLKYRFQFLEGLKLTRIELASAFIVENIPYWWKKGKTEKWRQ